jgi:AI-2 transport protein TqsA
MSVAVDGFSPGGRRLLLLAATVVVIAGIKAAAPVVGALMLGAAIAVAVSPLREFLSRHGWPRSLSVIVTVVTATVVLVALAALISIALGDLSRSLPTYWQKLTRLQQEVASWLAAHKLSHIAEGLGDTGMSQKVLTQLSKGMLGAASFLGSMALVFLLAILLLVEASSLPAKLGQAFPKRDSSRSTWRQIVGDVQRYLLVKTGTSLLTGTLIGLFTAGVGLDSPLLWGVLAFLLNYIPGIGSLIAAIPAVLLLLVDRGPLLMLVGIVGYLIVNVMVSNVLEPRLMGRALGLSAFVVILSMVFWGWVFGPVGALLSPPLTVLLQLACSRIDELSWVAVLLGRGAGRAPEDAG